MPSYPAKRIKSYVLKFVYRVHDSINVLLLSARERSLIVKRTLTPFNHLNPICSIDITECYHLNNNSTCLSGQRYFHNNSDVFAAYLFVAEMCYNRSKLLLLRLYKSRQL